MDRPLLLAVDFDGVLHNPNDVPKGYKLGQPIGGANAAMHQLKKQGAIITIHSVWADTEQKCEAMSKWLRYFDIPYDFITNKKPIADFYVDNRAIHHTSWTKTLNEIKERSEKEYGQYYEL